MNATDTPTLTITLHGSTTARFEPLGLEVTKTRGSVIAPLCREMIAAGIDPKATVKVMRCTTPCFIPKSLEQWAKLAVSEPDSASIRFALWEQASVERLEPLPARAPA